jgi:hypothetical protein
MKHFANAWNTYSIALKYPRVGLSQLFDRNADKVCGGKETIHRLRVDTYFTGAM